MASLLVSLIERTGITLAGREGWQARPAPGTGAAPAAARGKHAGH